MQDEIPNLINDFSTIPNWLERVDGEPDPSNREIIAYLSGKEDGKAEEIEERKKLFITNLELCCYYSGKFYDFLTKDVAVSCQLATIKANTLSDFKSLFVISFEDYKNLETRKMIYKQANEVRNSLKLKEICLEISILSTTEEFDEQEIKNDGYFLRYNPE